MPRLVIDNLEIEVPPGTKVIEAAERLGIMIPRFCYHPALGSVGACRVCAVTFLEGPVKGVEMSCMIEARDGMVVSTTDQEAKEFRKYVIEWLMLHHPHDCPVCDEGGHCLLQDETVSCGHGIRRYLGRKRTYEDQDLGPFVQHEMNRCIHCFRCRRFYQEFAGYRDLGVLQIGSHMYFGRFSDGALESPFSGNLIDICPTGVYTDKPARYRARRWDLQRGSSICLHCSLGCHTVSSARYREVLRQEARPSEKVNGYFICDRGRFGFDYANHPRRPRRPRLEGKEVGWEEALEVAGRELTRVLEGHGPAAVAALGSSRSSLEAQGELSRFCETQGWPQPCFFVDPALARKVKAAVERLDEPIAPSMRELEGADFLLGVGADPVNEAPMLALAMRQAYRNGATVAMIDPRPLSLPFEFNHVPVAGKEMDLCLSVLVKNALEGSALEKLGKEAMKFLDNLHGEYPGDAALKDRLLGLAESLQRSQWPVIVCGTDAVQESTPVLSADLGRLLLAAKGRAGVFYLLPGPNAYGAALLSARQGSAQHIVEGIETGGIKALILVEVDPFWSYPDRKRLAKALDMLELLLVMDHLPSTSVERAHVFLPTTTVFEGGGSWFINQEGRVQYAPAVHQGGLPIWQLTQGRHPPRSFSDRVPGSEPKPVGEIFRGLAAAMSIPWQGELAQDIRVWLSEHYSSLALFPTSVAGGEDLKVFSRERRAGTFSTGGLAQREAGASENGDELELLLVDWIFGTEELSCYSQYTLRAEKRPQLTLHGDALSRLGLTDGDEVVLDLPGGPLRLLVRGEEKMAKGVAIMPRHHELEWHRLKGWQVRISPKMIRKA